MARQTIRRDFTFAIPALLPAGDLAREVGAVTGHECSVFDVATVGGQRMVSYGLEIEPSPKMDGDRIAGICRAVQGVAGDFLRVRLGETV